jgi:uncharacterized membrane protein YgdD (TMEM256/DUF423 family)
MSPRWVFLCGVTLSGLGVALGAFGAHGLKDVLPKWYADPEIASARLENWETGVRYQLFHGIALILVGLALLKSNQFFLRGSSVCLTLGSVVFSGSLYLLVLSGQTYWGAITPLGGLLLLLAWILAGVGYWRLASSNSADAPPCP